MHGRQSLHRMLPQNNNTPVIRHATSRFSSPAAFDLPHVHAAVDVQNMAGNIAGLV
jgi:hypothetical protein